MQIQNNIFISLDEFEKIQKENECKVEYNNGEILLSSNSSIARGSFHSPQAPRRSKIFQVQVLN